MWKWRASVACLLFFCFFFSTTEATEEAPFSCADIWLNLLRNTRCVKEGIFRKTLYHLQSTCSMQTILKAVFGCRVRVRGWKGCSDNTEPKAQLWSIRIQSQIATLDTHTQAKAEPSQYNGKNGGLYLISKTTVYTEDATHIRRQNVTRNY
jgi:hypothetical protein